MSNVLSSSATKRPLCKVFRTMKISKVWQILTDGLNAFREWYLGHCHNKEIDYYDFNKVNYIYI
jgi:hypothetical protein